MSYIPDDPDDVAESSTDDEELPDELVAIWDVLDRCGEKRKREPEPLAEPAPPSDEMVLLNRLEEFGCDRWRQHFIDRGAFAPQFPQGTPGWLASRLPLSGSTFYEIIHKPVAEIARHIKDHQRGVRPVVEDPTDGPMTVETQHLARGHAGEPLVFRFLQEHLQRAFPKAKIFMLDFSSMPVPDMEYVSDSPDGAAVVCHCATGGECIAAAVEIKFPRSRSEITCPHLFHECVRLDEHDCTEHCPKPRDDLRRLFVPSAEVAEHPCERCMRAQMDYTTPNYSVGYYTQCLLHRLALGLDRTIFVRPAGIYHILRDFGLTEANTVADFKARVADYLDGRIPRLAPSRFRVHIVETPDNFIMEQYQRVFGSTEFRYYMRGGIATHFVALCGNKC